MQQNNPAEYFNDSAIRSLEIIAGLQGDTFDSRKIQQQFADAGDVLDAAGLQLAGKALNYKTRLIHSTWEELEKITFPVIAVCKNQQFCVLAGFKDNRALVYYPRNQKKLVMTEEAFCAEWGGGLVLFRKKNSFDSAGSTNGFFDISWFIPAVKRHKKLFAEILLASLLVQCLALATPLMFQVIVDKVLVHQGVSTLTVIATGMIFIAVFEVCLTFIRNYMASHTGSRIDVLLGAKLYQHLTSLPLQWFEARRVGDSVARVRELDTIRQFITGSSVTLIIDLLFTVVFFSVLYIYSPMLTFIVALSLPLYILLSVAVTPVLQTRLKEKFNTGAQNQAFLVETVSGMQSVKALAIEARLQRRWEDQLAAYISASFKAGNLGNLASALAGFINKITVVLILWVGAVQVMQQSMTIGQLIAFNMIAMRISSPVLRLVQLWQDFQQAGLSIKRLGDILNTAAEFPPSKNRAVLKRIKGDIDFKEVTFRYQADVPPALLGFNLTVRRGEIVGIVGKSGSGKSTVAKLIQRLYIPEAGQITLDMIDVNGLDPVWLRSHIGVVNQDNFLFNRSVRENIAIANPALSIEQVIQLAEYAGADEFIQRLPFGYETLIEEQGVNLSGGQRQRLAIARALAGNPEILVFDEATSSLDYESEQIIQKNMQRICHGRTVIMIAHRLNTLRIADKIVVMDKGCIVEQGTHRQLIDKQAVYAGLYAMQSGREVA